jgi:coenzyme F420-reducing hydrogenase alpha subunit
VRNLIVVPISFVSEHVETLEEIDDEFRQLAQECGVTKWRRVPALNTDPGFIQELADIVVSICGVCDVACTVATAACCQGWYNQSAPCVRS